MMTVKQALEITNLKTIIVATKDYQQLETQ